MGLHIGSVAPDFEQDSSEGKIKFHQGVVDRLIAQYRTS